MSRNPTRYALQELIGWEDFEKLATSVLYGMGFTDIKSAGGTKDGGKDAAVYKSNGDTIVVQISQEKDPLKETKAKKKSKFWREYEKWANDDKIVQFIFVSNQNLGNKKNTLIETLKSPPVDMYGIDELVNYLDYDETGKDIKKQYAISDKDLHEVFGAEDQDSKLNEVASVINQDEHYHIDTVLALSETPPNKPGAIFSTQTGQVIKYFTPKSYEDFLKAPPSVKVTLTAKRDELDQYMNSIRAGVGIQILSDHIKDIKFRVGDKILMDGVESKPVIKVSPVPDDKPRIIILRSKSDPDVAIRLTLKLTDKTLDEAVMNNYAAKEPIDIEARFNPKGELRMNYKFQLHRCRDAVVANRYVRIFNAVQHDTVELLIDDDGIERKLVEMPKHDGEPFSEGYGQLLSAMARIQDFFKVRIPNPLKEDIQITDSDRWSIGILNKIIDDGKADISVNSLSFVLLHDGVDKIRETAKEGVMALGSGSKLNMLSILGVTEFPNLELIVPKMTSVITDLGDGTSRVDVTILEKPYLRFVQEQFAVPTPSTSSRA